MQYRRALAISNTSSADRFYRASFVTTAIFSSLVTIVGDVVPRSIWRCWPTG
jgi:hypothetical protein